MSEQEYTGTVEELFDILIRAEKAAQAFYLRLTKMFAHEPQAAQVWWLMAVDEGAHIHLLEQARDALPPARLAAPADPHLLRAARSAAAFTPERNLAAIETLEDAYQVAHEEENSEINGVFETVISEYFPLAIQQEFVQSQLREHFGRLAVLKPPEWRKAVKARWDEAED